MRKIRMIKDMTDYKKAYETKNKLIDEYIESDLLYFGLGKDKLRQKINQVKISIKENEQKIKRRVKIANSQ